MPRRSRPALALLVALAACDPKPGARIEVHGAVTDIPNDPDLPGEGHHPHVVADGKFFWVSGGWLVAQPLTGGEKKQLASVENGMGIAVTRDDIVAGVLEQPSGPNGPPVMSLVAVPRAGGPARKIPLPPGAAGAAELHALTDAVLWLDSEMVWTDRIDLPPAVIKNRVMMLRPRDEHPEARELTQGTIDGEIVRLATDGRGAFLTASAISNGYRIDVHDSVDAPARKVGILPFAAIHGKNDRDEMDLALGSEHVFTVAPHHLLMATTLPLVAVPRQGGASATVHSGVCPGTLTVSGDVPYFVTPTKGTHCPGEFPVAQKLEVHRGSLTAKSLRLYEAYDSAIWLEQLAANQLILREGVGIPKPAGTMPESRYRSALFTFDP